MNQMALIHITMAWILQAILRNRTSYRGYHVVPYFYQIISSRVSIMLRDVN